MGEAMLAVRLLTTTRRERAIDLAWRLEGLNEKRQKLEREAVQTARELVQAQKREDDPVLILASPGWHAGVVGIVAGRLAEQYGRPALLITLPRPRANENGRSSRLAVGSGRSIPGF